MISMKTLLTEGRYDSIVTRLSRTLFDVVKASYSAVSDPDGKFAGKKIYYDPTAGETIPDINATSPAGQEEPQPAVYFEEVENQSIPLATQSAMDKDLIFEKAEMHSMIPSLTATKCH
jgi:hypothetical protein